MPDWLKGSATTEHDLLEWDHLLDVVCPRLALAFVLGCFIAGVYRLTRRREADTPSLVPTLVLLTVLIAMVTLVIGGSIARAFSLVGALAIVRFRTIVEDARDTAFVIFAVTAGMGAAAYFPTVLVVGVPLAAVAALLFRPRRPAAAVPETGERLLTVRVGAGYNSDALLKTVFDAHLEHAALTAAVTSRQGAALDLTYAVRLRNEGGAVALVTALNGLEGVQSVELRQG